MQGQMMNRDDEMVLITSELIREGRSGKGGWTKPQLAILGVKWPPKIGWMNDPELTRRRIRLAQAERFLELNPDGFQPKSPLKIVRSEPERVTPVEKFDPLLDNK